jgi:hypothetical protein
MMNDLKALNQTDASIPYMIMNKILFCILRKRLERLCVVASGK